MDIVLWLLAGLIIMFLAYWQCMLLYANVIVARSENVSVSWRESLALPLPGMVAAVMVGTAWFSRNPALVLSDGLGAFALCVCVFYAIGFRVTKHLFKTD